MTCQGSWKKRHLRKNGESGHKIPGFDQLKKELLAEPKSVKHKDLDDMVYTMELTYDENVDLLDLKYTAVSTNE